MWLEENRSAEVVSYDRRTRQRFPIRRELQYTVRDRGKIIQAGSGITLNISSSGIAFRLDQPLAGGGLIELSISWPALLDGVLPIRLKVFGRVLRTQAALAVCIVEKYEFRTQGLAQVPALRAWSAASPSA